MLWDEYKELCDHPSVLTRWLVQQTLRICDSDCTKALESILNTPPLIKPLGHKGGLATDMFQTSLAREVVVEIIEQVQLAIANDAKTTGPIERDYSSIGQAWLEYLHWCDAQVDCNSQE